MGKSVICGLILAALSGAFFCSCTNKNVAENDVSAIDTLTTNARLLTMVERADGVVLATIKNPWQQGQALGTYAFVPCDSAVPEDLPAGVRVLRTPVERMAVFSAVHASALGELGAQKNIVATVDVDFLPADNAMRQGVESGEVLNAGNSQSPSLEILAQSQAQAVLRSPIKDNTLAKLPASMVPVECVDYMETTPLARAEWILLLGELAGERDSARTIYNNVVERYNKIVSRVAESKEAAPKVLVETEYSGVWYVPAGESYMARMIADAGGDYPWKDTEGSGSLNLNLESVAHKAIDADVWLVRSYGYETTPASLTAMNSRYSVFKALQQGNIYSCNSAERNIFDDVAFHPELVLADYAAIFHPDVFEGYKLRYFIRSSK